MDWLKKILEIFETQAAVAKVCGLKSGAHIPAWKKGVPAKHRKNLIKAAKKKGFALTEQELRAKV